MAPSGYYKWLKGADKPEKDHEDFLLIEEIFKKGRSKLGWRSIQMRLSTTYKMVMNHKKISRIMRKYQLFTKIRRPNPYRLISKKTLEHRIFPNELNRQFKELVPFTKLCTDITYVPYNNQMAFVSTIKDIATGEIVGWNAAPHITMDLVMDTLSSMKQHRHASLTSWDQVLIHSDQGFHYTNPLYTHELRNLNIVQSMSRKGNCHDNAPMESFFGHMKDDIDYKSCKTFAEVAVVVNNYIEYYNNERCQWGLKKMTPVGYRDHLLATNV